jgi:hypothetical protein
MKYKIPFIFSVIACAAVHAQQPAPVQTPAQTAPAEPTKAPAPKPEVAPDTVVASVEGKSLTAAEVDKLIAGLPPQLQQNVQKDRRQFLQQWAPDEKKSWAIVLMDTWENASLPTPTSEYTCCKPPKVDISFGSPR